jgi:transcription initiation factor TFIID subunit 2
MVGIVEASGHPSSQEASLGFSVSHQKVHLEFDLVSRKLRGTTEITVSPSSKELRAISFHCRQCRITRLSVNGKGASSKYVDPYNKLNLGWNAGVHQYHLLQGRIEDQLKAVPDPELVITLSRSLIIQEIDPFSSLDSTIKVSSDPASIDLTQHTKSAVEQNTRYTPIFLKIDFSIDNIRDGMQFVGWDGQDLRYPHAFSQNSPTRPASCLFPCLYSINSPCTWEISIKCPTTIGDAFKKRGSHKPGQTNGAIGVNVANRVQDPASDVNPGFSDEDSALDLVVICSGDISDEVRSFFSNWKLT